MDNIKPAVNFNLFLDELHFPLTFCSWRWKNRNARKKRESEYRMKRGKGVKSEKCLLLCRGKIWRLLPFFLLLQTPYHGSLQFTSSSSPLSQIFFDNPVCELLQLGPMLSSNLVTIMKVCQSKFCGKSSFVGDLSFC